MGFVSYLATRKIIFFFQTKVHGFGLGSPTFLIHWIMLIILQRSKSIADPMGSSDAWINFARILGWFKRGNHTCNMADGFCTPAKSFFCPQPTEFKSQKWEAHHPASDLLVHHPGLVVHSTVVPVLLPIHLTQEALVDRRIITPTLPSQRQCRE